MVRFSVFVSLVVVLTYQEFAMVSGNNYCNETMVSKFFTACRTCRLNMYARCPPGSRKIDNRHVSGRRDCFYQINSNPYVPVRGCRHVCLKVRTIPNCCSGYWGLQCDHCPGGAVKPCNGHGACSNGTSGNGTCSCENNFSGYACENCVNNTMYGTNCTGVCSCVNGKCNSGVFGDGSCQCYSGFKGQNCSQVIPGCDQLNCTENSQCVELQSNATCQCEIGYKKDTNGTCNPIDRCLDNPCNSNATCVFTGPATYNCTCLPGYNGDGMYCDSINPCDTDNGGCGKHAWCYHIGPGKRECTCQRGYENFTDGIGCKLTDVCATRGSECDKNAVCRITSPGMIRCYCKPGYLGNGRFCYGNLIQRIEYLNTTDDVLKGQLTLSKQILDLYEEPLTDHGPFTLFVPVDPGIRAGLYGLEFSDLLSNRTRCLQIIRQHIIVGALSFNALAKSTSNTYYTLQGTMVHFIVPQNVSGFKFSSQGSIGNYSVLKADVPATNGIVHVIDRPLMEEHTVYGDETVTILNQIKIDADRDKFYSLVKIVDMGDAFEADNITVFVPDNESWDKLPEGTMDYLQYTTEGNVKLKTILKNHLFNDTISAAELIRNYEITSMARFSNRMKVKRGGLIQISYKINVTRTEIPASNGFMYHVSGILTGDLGITSHIPNKCDKVVHRVTWSRCSSCSSELPCPRTEDVAMKKIVAGCWYRAEPSAKFGPYHDLRPRPRLNYGCKRQCNRTFITPSCCDGFYGYDCMPCRGGFIMPCNNNGKCSDGVYGNGTCQCDKGFEGVACEKCVDKNKFGEKCDKNCTCLFGECDSGPEGSGKCRNNTCHEYYNGDNCAMTLVPCPEGLKICHHHSICATERNISITRCICNPGYEGDGEDDCVEINPCNKPDRGGCHLQADCLKTGPGLHKCACRDGWVGDGSYCYPSTPCSTENECHQNATCINTIPGKSICICKKNYHGNGTYCVLNNLCEEKHGGCHAMASCSPVGPGKVSCECPGGMIGDGFSCYGTIAREIMNNPELAALAELLKKLPEDFYLYDEDRQFTFFAPTNHAADDFLKKAPPGYWDQVHHIEDFFNFHTLSGAMTENSLNHTFHGFETYFHGYTIHFVYQRRDLWIFAGETEYCLIEQSDHPAVNGFIHVIDKVLEPFYLKDLGDFFELNPMYSKFGDYLDSTGLWDELGSGNDYTMFAPTNAALERVTMKITKRFLKYYIIPKVLLSASIKFHQTEATLLGTQQQLQFEVYNQQVLVNKQKIINADNIIDAGIIHGIDGLMHPVLHRCDVTVRNTSYTECFSCDSDEMPCPQGSDILQYIPHDCVYEYSGTAYLGCHNLCEAVSFLSQCCAGYYGDHCEGECPGGAENSCNDHGTCDDGADGSGNCTCDEGWLGDDCSKAAPSCDVDNGGCHSNASCEMHSGKVECTCMGGFDGDGYSCDKVCVDNDCHINAQCSKLDGELQCVCLDGFHGDGVASCKVVADLCENSNGGCAKLAKCEFNPPTATEMRSGSTTCICPHEYIGDGRIFCNADTLTTLANHPSTSKFFSTLVKKEPGRAEIIKLLDNATSDVTIFVPVNSATDVQNLTSKEILSHIINGTRLLINATSSNATIYESAAETSITISMYEDEVLVNDIEIVQANIPTLNGYIHLIASRFVDENTQMPSARKSTKPTKHTTLIIIVCAVLGGLFFISIVTFFIVMMYRNSRTGSILISGKRRGSGSSIQRLHDSSSDSSHVFPNPSPNPSTAVPRVMNRRVSQNSQENNFVNPLFSSFDDDDN